MVDKIPETQNPLQPALAVPMRQGLPEVVVRWRRGKPLPVEIKDIILILVCAGGKEWVTIRRSAANQGAGMAGITDTGVEGQAGAQLPGQRQGDGPDHHGDRFRMIHHHQLTAVMQRSQHGGEKIRQMRLPEGIRQHPHHSRQSRSFVALQLGKTGQLPGRGQRGSQPEWRFPGVERKERLQKGLRLAVENKVSMKVSPAPVLQAGGTCRARQDRQAVGQTIKGEIHRAGPRGDIRRRSRQRIGGEVCALPR